MTDFIEQISNELSERVAATTLDKIDARLVALARKQFKPFFTFKEMATIFGCSVSTIRQRATDGLLSYSKNFNGEAGCTPAQIDEYFKRNEVRKIGAIRETAKLYSIKKTA